MNSFKNIFYALILALLTATMSCSTPGKEAPQEAPQEAPGEEVSGHLSEAKQLMDYLVEVGDYVNSRNFPSLIKASAVYDELDGNIHIIDIRQPEHFAKGHIKGAVQVNFSDLPEYFASQIKPFEFDMIIIACYEGQYSSYTTSLLRLLGYGNVYSLRWGMSGWNDAFAKDYWKKVVSNTYEDQLETGENAKSPAGALPELNTGKSTGEDIHTSQMAKLFSEGLKGVLVNADEVFENPAKYYVINYERKDKYEAGHIPGAVRYKPNATLGILSEMETIPAGKEIVVYCGTGHNSGFVTAYLRLLGYNAHTLECGNNSFMYDKMLKERETLSWLPFTDNEISNFPFVKK